jgi:mercuric ion transport protein
LERPHLGRTGGADLSLHLSLLAAVLAGTSVGGFIGDHWSVAAVALFSLLLLSLTQALQAFRGNE